MRSKFFVAIAVLMVLSVVLGACKPAAQETAIKTLKLNMGPGDIPTLDPSLAEDTSSNQIIELLTVGVTRQNEVTAGLEPGMAESWDLSEDGKTVTFHIRQGIPWVKYDAVSGEVVQVMDCQEEPQVRTVTAFDFVYALQRTLMPANASPYAYVLYVIEGAADYNNGVTDDFTTVGVKALDSATLEVKFVDAAVYNVNIIGMWVGHAEPSWVIDGDDCTEARGERWIETGFNQSYGPYALKEWVHDSYITVIKNPFWPGIDSSPQAKIDEITWLMLDEVPAFAEYEAGNIQVAGVPLADIDRVKADPKLSKELIIAPVLCTYYYGFNTTAPFVDDVRVRRALSEAVDRQSLVDNVTKGGQEPAQWFGRPGLGAAPTIESHPDLGVKFNPEDARAQLQSYLDEKGLTLADLDITLMFNTSSGHQKIAEAIQQMWKDNLGLDVKLVNQEWAVYLATVKSLDTPQIWRLGWCQDYPDENNFIKEVFGVGNSSNPTDADGNPSGGVMWNNPTFEQLIKDAATELDPAKRLDMYAQAEQILVWDDAVMIPIYWYTRVTVTKPEVTRTFSVLGGLEHIEKWDVK